MNEHETSYGNAMEWSRSPWYLLGVGIVDGDDRENHRVEHGALVKPGPFQLFQLLASYADYDEEEQTGQCHPSRGRLAKNLGVTKETIDNWTNELERVGAVRVVPAFGKPPGRAFGRDDGRQTTNGYELAFYCPFEPDKRTHGRKKIRREGEASFAGESEPGFAPELDPVRELDPDGLDERLFDTFGASSSGAKILSPLGGANDASPLTLSTSRNGDRSPTTEIEF